jgi:hypothetical protein
MKKWMSLGTACLLTMGFCGASSSLWAQDEDVVNVISADEVSGTVRFVDAQGWRLTVVSPDDAGEKPTLVVVRGSSVIEKDGKAATLADMSIGDDVAVRYQVDEKGENVAIGISATSQQ